MAAVVVDCDDYLLKMWTERSANMSVAETALQGLNQLGNTLCLYCACARTLIGHFVRYTCTI